MVGEEREPVELIGVYHADGGVVGELSYVIGKLRGTAHCALCDITHNAVRRKPEWKAACRDFTIPIRLVHLNERSAEEIAACTVGTPAVLVRFSDDELEPLMGPDDLELDGSVDAFFARLTDALKAS